MKLKIGGSLKKNIDKRNKQLKNIDAFMRGNKPSKPKKKIK